MKQLIRRLATLAAVTGGAIFVRWWLTQQEDDDNDNNNPPPPPEPQLPPDTPFSLDKQEQLIVLPPEAFVGTPTAGTYIVPHSNGNGHGTVLQEDDLTKIDTITPEIDTALRAVGVANFVTLAHANPVILYEQLQPDFGVSQQVVIEWVDTAREWVAQ